MLCKVRYGIATGCDRESATKGPTYQNQILNQVGQATVREHEQTGHWSGNALGVTVALAQLVVVVFG